MFKCFSFHRELSKFKKIYSNNQKHCLNRFYRCKKNGFWLMKMKEHHFKSTDNFSPVKTWRPRKTMRRFSKKTDFGNFFWSIFFQFFVLFFWNNVLRIILKQQKCSQRSDFCSPGVHKSTKYWIMIFQFCIFTLTILWSCHLLVVQRHIINCPHLIYASLRSDLLVFINYHQ